MSPAERLVVARLATRIAELPDEPKDPDAVSEVKSLLRARPDASYWLFQQCLGLQLALEQAAAHVDQMQKRLDAFEGTAPPGFGASAGNGAGSKGPRPAVAGTGTTGGVASGAASADAAGRADATKPAAKPTGAADRPIDMPQLPARGNATVAGADAGRAAPTVAASAGGGGFLRNALAMGAGVLGGNLLFQGLGNMLGGHRDDAWRASRDVTRDDASRDDVRSGDDGRSGHDDQADSRADAAAEHGAADSDPASAAADNAPADNGASDSWDDVASLDDGGGGLDDFSDDLGGDFGGDDWA